MRIEPGLRAFLVLVATLLVLNSSFASDWAGTLDQADRLFNQGKFSQAAEKYNQSAQMALEAGARVEAASIFAKLGRCFSEGRLNDHGLFVRYLKKASDLVEEAAEKQEQPTRAANLFLDSANFAREAGLIDEYRERVNASGFSFLRAAEQGDFDSSSTYLLKAGYIFEFNNLTAELDTALSTYRDKAGDEANRLLSMARNTSSEGRWDEAGRSYFRAAVILKGLGEESSANIFGLAAKSFLKATSGGSASLGNESLAASKGEFLRLAAISSYFNGTDASDTFALAAEAYSETGDGLADSTDLKSLAAAYGNISMAADAYSKAGYLNLSSKEYLKAGQIAEKLASKSSSDRYRHELEAARSFDLGNNHLSAEEAYLNSLASFPFQSGTSPYPWQYMDLFQILGEGRRPLRARRLADFLSSQGLASLTFFGAPSFGGYDVMMDLGSSVAKVARDNHLYRAYVTETLMTAAAHLINGLTEEASSLMEEVPKKTLLLDPPNQAFLSLLEEIARSQEAGGSGGEIPTKEAALKGLYFNDLCLSLDEVLPHAIFLIRCQGMFRSLLADLREAPSYGKDIDTYYSQAQTVADRLTKSGIRNTTEHAEIAALLEVPARRWMFQGRLNESGSTFELAAYHACAAEEYQKAILFHDFSAGCFEARTPLTAAVYAVATSMLAENQTLKDHAASYISSNLSKYLQPENVAVLLSVLEGRTRLGAASPIYNTLSLALLGAFVLLTSYALLVWEPKHPLQKGKAEEKTVQEGEPKTAPPESEATGTRETAEKTAEKTPEENTLSREEKA